MKTMKRYGNISSGNLSERSWKDNGITEKPLNRGSHRRTLKNMKKRFNTRSHFSKIAMENVTQYKGLPARRRVGKSLKLSTLRSDKLRSEFDSASVNPLNSSSSHSGEFTEADYNSRDGMLTTIWGPGMWHFLHTISFNYPVKPTMKDKKNYREFILGLKNILPCGKCRENFKKNLSKLPITLKDMKSRHTFSLYIYNLHEVINKMLNKTSGLSYETVKERYEHFRARCLVNQSTKNENGCVNPIYGEKSKCVLQIVPQTKKCDSITIDPKCMKKRIIFSKNSVI